MILSVPPPPVEPRRAGSGSDDGLERNCFFTLEGSMRSSRRKACTRPPIISMRPKTWISGGHRSHIQASEQEQQCAPGSLALTQPLSAALPTCLSAPLETPRLPAALRIREERPPGLPRVCVVWLRRTDHHPCGYGGGVRRGSWGSDGACGM